MAMQPGMKRAYSESEDEEEYSSERCLEGEDDEATARKRRRGLIEKKRRDRINSCLSELRRLVPAAVHKQGSTKLEKAEILQLTVEHLKNVRNLAKREAASIEGADYRAAGFRECLSEVSRYLQTFQDPNCKEDQKAQLLSHLNTIITHRLHQPQSAAVWPQGLTSRVATAHALPLATAEIRASHDQPSGNTLPKDLGVNKEKTTLIKNQNILIRPAMSGMGVPSRPVEPTRYSLTMFPAAAHCTRSENLMLRLPLVQHKSEQIMFGANTKNIGSDPSIIKSFFCQRF